MSKFLYFVVIVAGFLVLYSIGRAWRLKPETKYDHVPHSGEVAVLTAQGGDSVWLAVDKNDCYAVNVAMTRKDAAYLKTSAEKNIAFAVAAGTSVKLTGESVSRRRVEVVAGPLTGKSGWVEFEYLRPRQPAEVR